MSNTTIALRSSGVTGNVPSLGDIVDGELSLNFADGILYYKTASNTLGSIRTTEPSGLTTEVQFNDAGSFGTNAFFTYDKTSGTLSVPKVIATARDADLEGGQIELANSVNGSLQGNIAIDIYDSKLRIFETSGTNRGVYIDLFSAGAGVGTDLLGGAAGVSSIGGASGVVSNTQLLSFVSTVDGEGSGLDADLLDGHQGSYYATNTYAISAYTQANTANTNAVNAGTYANAAFEQANTANTTSLAAYSQANTANTNAINAGTYANASFSQANTANITAESAFTQANIANTRAYQTVLKTGDTISGDLVIEGNLTIQGTQVLTSTSTLAITDNMIYLNNPISANITNAVGNGTSVVYTTAINHNYLVGLQVTVSGVTPSSFNIVTASNTLITAVTSNTFTVTSSVTDTYVSGGTARARSGANPDIGFAAGYNDGAYHHAGLFRDATDGIWKFFDNYGPEPDESIYIDTSNTTFRIANLTANLVTQSVIVTGDSSISNLTGAIKVTGGIGVQGNVSVDAIIFPDGTTQSTASAGGGGSSSYNTSLLFTKADGSTANMTLRVADTQLTSALNSVYVPFLLSDGTTAKNLYVST